MTDADPIRLDLLLFSVGGVHFGADTEQIAAIAQYGGEPSDDLYWFHTLVEYGAATVTYDAPMVVTLKTGSDATQRVVIDAMETIAECTLPDIHPFPAHLAPFAMKKGLWGVLARNGQMVLLVDFMRICPVAAADSTGDVNRKC